MTTDDSQEARLVAAHEADPQTNRWGIATADPGIVGISMFHWYETEDLLREALLRGDFALDAEPDDVARTVAELRPLIASPGSFHISRRELVNSVVCDLFSVVWWGSFEALCTDDHDETREFRIEFRGRNDDDREPVHRGISADERAAFTDFLREWGY